MTLPRPLVTLRLLRLLRLLLVLTLTALAAPLFVSPAGDTAAAAATGSAKTVRGTWQPWKANDRLTEDPDGIYGPWWDGKYEDKTPSVTVDRTTNLGDEVVSVSWQNFTPTSNDPQYAPPEENGQPTAIPFRPQEETNAYYGVDILQCRGTAPTRNPQYTDVSKQECYDFYTDNPQDGAPGPNNRVRAVTQNDGTGFAQFHVENRTSNNLLRCSPTQPCSIVVVPNQGGRFVQGAADQSTVDCDDHTYDFGATYNEFGPYFAGTDGRLSPCSWSKRIVVPLSFASIADNCPDTKNSFSAAGAPTLTRGLNQLLAGWCRGSQAVTFDYNFGVTEESARSDFLTSESSGFSSDTDVALTSRPADPGLAKLRKFAYAPIANNAVTIAYTIDNIRTGRPITDIRLTPRLVAKLLTQSYSPKIWDCKREESMSGGKTPKWCASDVRNNPNSVFDDPEFQELNFRGDHPDRDSFPGGNLTPPNGSQQDYGSYFTIVASGESDQTYALTRWIAADPDANAFLRGASGPGGRINPNYRVKGGSLYPTSHFDALEPGYSAPNVAFNGDAAADPRLKQGFQGAWNPVAVPSLVTENLLRGRSTATLRDGVCDNVDSLGTCSTPQLPTLTVRFPRTAPEPIGVRDLTGVTDNTESQANAFSTADLLTSKGTFVGPDREAMAAAAAGLSTNADGVTQTVDFDTASRDAYPLLLPVYAMVPTCGLTPAKATGIRAMLNRVLSSQTYGDSPGKLARGLLKLTAKQLDDTRQAARAVSSKACATSGGTSRDVNPDGDNGGGNGNSNGNTDTGAGGGGGTGNATTPPNAANSPAASSPATTGATGGASAPDSAQNIGYRLDDDGGSVSLLPILLLVGGLVLIGGPVGWWALATAPGRTMRDRVRHLVVGAGGWRR